MLSYFFPSLRSPKPETEVCSNTGSEEQLLSGLARLCSLPDVQPGEALNRISDERVKRVSSILLVLDNRDGRKGWRRWSDRPRTYIILWNLNGLEFMDTFIEKNFTDIWLPYNSRTLPGFIYQENMRAQFLVVQNFLLTSARELEDLSSQASPTTVLPHIHLDGSGDHHFRRISSLGQGGFGAVDEVWSSLSLRRYARKRVLRGRQSSEANRRAQEYLVKELTDLKSLSHRHLVKVFGSYTDKEYIAFLMQPVAECNLHDFLAKPEGLSNSDRHDVRRFFGCLAGAVHYLHDCNIRHRDLSSRNILIHQGSVYISDLGSAYKWAGNASHGSVTQDRHVPTSPEYMAPEVAKRAPRCSSSDMWSLGVVFLEMTTLLVGRTLQHLRFAVEKNAKSRNLEPYIWANPRMVNIWVNELQQSNKGPMHDNEPLAWIRDLLDELPNNRPKSRGLMQDILECPSFNIFCCIECQPDFRERRFEYSGRQPTPQGAFEDPTDLKNDIASIFQEDLSQSVVISAQKSSSIETWLAGTEADHSSWNPPLMPGSFHFGNPHEVGVCGYTTPPEASLASDIENDGFRGRGGTPPPPPVCAFDLNGSNLSTEPTIEIGELLGDTEFYPELARVGTKVPSHNAPPKRARDTGLGFMEYNSSSSSDEETRLFNEIEDSSGSDTNSDATILPSKLKGNECVLYGNLGKVPALAWTLPNFSGEENSWIKTLDTLPEDQESVEEITHLPSKGGVADNSNERDEGAEASGFTVFELDGSEMTVDMVGSNLNETSSALPIAEQEKGFVLIRNIDNGQELPYPVEISRNDTPHTELSHSMQAVLDIGVQKRPLDAVTVTTANSPDSTITQTIDSAPIPIEGSTRPAQSMDLSRTLQGMAAQYLENHGLPETVQWNTDIRQEQNSAKKRAPQKKTGMKDDSSCVPVRPIALPYPPGIVQNDGKVTTSISEPEQLSEPGNERYTNITPESPPRLQRSPTRVDGPRRRLPSANIDSLGNSLPASKPFERKKSTFLPGMSATDYIEDTWESASSVATSAMSEGTSKILQAMSLSKWLDRDHKLLETFCAKGNVQAVRVLLSKGCNPGRAAGSKQGRRCRPIMVAIQGASLKHNKCVKELIKYDVDVNVINRRSGKTPLHIAIENPYFNGYEQLIRDLIEAGADTNKVDSNHDYPIMKVFSSNDARPLEDHRRRALALLLRESTTKVDVTQPGTLNTSLHLAVRRKDPYAAGMLLHKKADVNARNASGTTPLLLTANQFQSPLTKDHIVLLELLLETEGISIDEKAGVNEQTALHYAIKAGVLPAVKLLITHGANPHCTDSKGHDAFALALKHIPEQSLKEHLKMMRELGNVVEKT